MVIVESLLKYSAVHLNLFNQQENVACAIPKKMYFLNLFHWGCLKAFHANGLKCSI